jgi:alanyl-tRNA synthetase
LKASEIRSSFLRHFESRDHRVVRSASLIPAGDPTLLFTNAGMNQFKDTFLGHEKRDYTRATTAQKCLRVSGKHNDLEQVGRTARHHTFFEMLGNFSFGDYFKEEAISLAWEWITKVLGMDQKDLWITVFREDDEAEELWKRVAGVRSDRIRRLDEKDNFWSMGETGPCGPCSEIYFDQGPSIGCGRKECAVDCECGRYLEFWNLVFMQYDRQPGGEVKLLARPSIDTGAGLERVAALMQGVETNYKTDLFLPLINAISLKAKVEYGSSESSDVCMQVISDHLRAITFLIADGIIPSNEKRGYVLRRVIRRALTFGKTLKLEPSFLHQLTGNVVEQMGVVYPELMERRELIAQTCEREEQAFEATLARGVEVAGEIYRKYRGAEVAPEKAVDLYTTYGLSFEIQEALAMPFGTRMPAAETLEAEMEKHRERARASWKRAEGHTMPKELKELGASVNTTFVGYDKTELADARAVSLFNQKGPVESLEEGNSGYVVLDRTPFYAESGGQVGDTGSISSDDGALLEVEDTTSPAAGLVVHHVQVLSGSIAAGSVVRAEVHIAARAATMRNHTATHLLHAALKKVLGEQTQQAGSSVGPDRLRFDFNFSRPVKREEIAAIEQDVNEQILLNTIVEKTEKSFDEAMEGGAVALFGEKYGDKVRVVSVPGYSKELCGGTHCSETGDIGQMIIVSEKGIAAGVRRLEAVTGLAALERARRNEWTLRSLEKTLNKKRDEVEGSLIQLQKDARELKRETDRLKLKLAQSSVGSTDSAESEAFEDVEGVRLLVRSVDGLDRSAMRSLADNLKREIKSGVVVLGSGEEGKVALLVAVTDDLLSRVDARAIIKHIAPMVGGGGGGKPALAEAGGKRPEKLKEALAGTKAALAGQLGGSS